MARGRSPSTGWTPATWRIEETPPATYVAVLIGDCYEQGDEPSGSYSYLAGEFSTEVEIPDDGSYHWVCDWFNILTNDPGEVTIYKWTCPAGYDISAYGANAAEDCTVRANGIRFNAAGTDYASQSDTGDSIDGAVYFGGLVPGDYTFTETLPADTLYVFIADCTGTSVDAVHPYPLSVGNPLLVRVNPGDRIVCNWYNVPKVKAGTIVLTKYICSTPAYTSAVNCEIYEGGVTFTLLYRDGGGLTEVTDGTTGATGQLTWLELPPGQYTVREEGGYAPCRITASQLDGGYIAVTDGATTYVSVYNCRTTTSPSPGTSVKPRPSNTPPGKFPNTGTDPNAIARPAGGVNEGRFVPAPVPPDRAGRRVVGQRRGGRQHTLGQRRGGHERRRGERLGEYLRECLSDGLPIAERPERLGQPVAERVGVRPGVALTRLRPSRR